MAFEDRRRSSIRPRRGGWFCEAGRRELRSRQGRQRGRSRSVILLVIDVACSVPQCK